jgi:hypothetical protein
MRVHRIPLALKRLVLALAVTQLVAVTLAPLHERAGTPDHGPVRVERAHSPAGAPAHDPDTCPLCQLVTAHLIGPVARPAPAHAVAGLTPRAPAATLLPARAPPSAHRTRAPPSPLA